MTPASMRLLGTAVGDLAESLARLGDFERERFFVLLPIAGEGGLIGLEGQVAQDVRAAVVLVDAFDFQHGP